MEIRADRTLQPQQMIVALVARHDMRAPGSQRAYIIQIIVERRTAAANHQRSVKVRVGQIRQAFYRPPHTGAGALAGLDKPYAASDAALGALDAALTDRTNHWFQPSLSTGNPTIS